MIYSTLYWIGAVLFHLKASDYVFHKGMNIGLHKKEPLYDIIQKNCWNLKRYRLLPEILHFIPLGLMFLFFIYYCFNFSNSINAIQILETFFNKHGTLFYMRPILFSSTLLPDSSQSCLTSKTIGSCFDLIFSGHSSIMFLSTYILRDYFFISSFAYYLLQFNNLFTSFLIILCRNHYTVDVLLAIIITHYVYFSKDMNIFFS
jgi:hypothetical protein